MSRHDEPDHPHLPPLIRTQADLERTWRTLMEPLGFGGASVWVMLIGADDRPVPQLTEITDTGSAPSEEDVKSFAIFLGELVGAAVPGGRVALLRTRPGRHRTGADDLAWAQSLYAACAGAGLPTEVVHLATDETLVPLPFDAVDLRPTG